MTKYDEMLTRLKTAHMFFGAQAEKKGEDLLVKCLLEGSITQEEYEDLSEKNKTMVCDETWTDPNHA